MSYNLQGSSAYPLRNVDNGDGTSTLIMSPGTLSAPSNANNGTVSYPDSVTEVYRFYFNATLLRTTTLTYADATKAQLTAWAVT